MKNIHSPLSKFITLCGSLLLLLAVTAGTSMAQSAPVVRTDPASGVTAIGGNVNGLVIPNGLDTVVFFHYGLTGSYGGVTQTQDIGSGAAGVSVSGTLSGLQPGTLYHYALTATNSAGSVTGADQVFQTAVTSIQTETASNLTGTSATMNGQVTPAGIPTIAWFKYGTTSAYGSVTQPQSLGAGPGGI